MSRKETCWDRWNDDGPVDDREMEALGSILPGAIALVVLIVKVLSVFGAHMHP